MLDLFLAESYRQERTKTASRELVDKLKEFPIEELKKLASGDPTSKIACGGLMSSGPGDGSWLEQYKGSPLFNQAVEIERNLLQLDAEDQQRRGAQREEDQARWDARDSLLLKRRMLDLDLALAKSGGGPEQQEEKGVQMLEQAQAEERAAGEGGEPHEQAEDQAIQQFRAAQSQEAAAQAQQQPPKPKAPPKAPPKEPSEPVSDPQVEVKAAGAKVASAVRAGRLLAREEGMPKTALSHGRIIDAVRKAPADGKRLGKAFEHGVSMLGGKASGRVLDQADTLASAAGARLGGGDWRRELTTMKSLRKTSSAEPEDKSKLQAEVAKKYPALAKSKVAAYVPIPAVAGGLAGSGKAHEGGNNPIMGALLGATGATAGTGLGGLAGRALSRGAGLNAGGPGALLAEVAAGGLGGLAGYKALTHGLDRKEKKAGIIGSAMAAAPGVMKGLAGAGTAAKNLVQTAHASGGMGQVAKSLGTVGKQFATKNPLAAAGMAGGAGLLAGRAMAPSQPRM